LGLRLNTKTQFFWLARPCDLKEFIKSLKKVSRDDDYWEKETEKNPQEKIEEIFKQVIELKKTKLGSLFDYEKSPEEDVLKSVFDPDVNLLLNAPHYIPEIENLFLDFNFDLVKAQPLILSILILKSRIVSQRFKDYLLSLNLLSTREVNLYQKYLSQTGFQDQDLLKRLEENEYMKPIIEFIRLEDLSVAYPGYFSLTQLQVASLADSPNIVQQIRLRVTNEKQRFHTVALNHLLNEFHAICHFKEQVGTIELKDYTAMNVENFLSAQNIPHIDRVSIRNLFDRRNETQVSHSGSVIQPSQEITIHEYREFYDSVGRCLKLIL